MDSARKSVYQIYHSSLQLGKYIGIVPFDFRSPSTSFEKKHEPTASRFWCICTAPFRFIPVVTFCCLFFFLTPVTCLQIFGLRVINDTLKAIIWNLVCLSPVAVIIMMRSKSSRIQGIIHGLYTTGRRLIQVYSADRWKREVLTSILKNERKFYGLCMLSGLFCVIGLALVAAYDEYYLTNKGETLAVIYTLGRWSYAFSAMLIRFQGQMLLLYPARSTNFSITLISASKEIIGSMEKNGSGISSKELALWSRVGFSWKQAMVAEESFEDSIQTYLELRNIIRQFNRIYSNSMLLYKGIALICCTLLIYYPSRSGYDKEMSTTTCYFATAMCSGQAYIMLYSMGQVYAASERFASGWKKVLAWNGELTPKNAAIIKSIVPIGFEVGEFYKIKPTTILTFYSVLLSYLLLIYQI